MKYTFTFEAPEGASVSDALQAIHDTIGKEAGNTAIHRVPAMSFPGFELAAEEPFSEQRGIQTLFGSELFTCEVRWNDAGGWTVYLECRDAMEEWEFGSYGTTAEANAKARKVMQALIATEASVSALFDLDTD